MRAVIPNERARRLLRKGDLLLEKSGGGNLLPVGVVMLYEHDDLAVCSNFVARMPVASPHDSQYLAYLHSHLYALKLNVRSIKQTTGIQNLDSYSYLCERVALPPSNEQTAIARFLDYATDRIDRYIRAREKLIALLEEQKQVVIHDAVTGRIDVRTGKPYPTYKPSGIEWLGEVPSHWEVFRLKSLMANVVDQTNSGALGGAFLALEHVESWTGKLNCPEHAFTAEGQFKSFRAGDVLFGKLRPYLAKVTRPEVAGCCVGEFLVLRSQRTRYDGCYAEHFLRSKLVIDTINSSTYGARMPRAEWTFIGSLRVPCPPLPEQTAIVRYLDDSIMKTSRAIDRKRREIELLREYRSRLIADAVVGKIDVRDVAAQLPELDAI